MGDMIVMSRAKASATREFFAGHSADILFFTGVRYYRMDEAADAPVAAVKLKLTKAAGVKRRRSLEHRPTAKRLLEQRLEALA